MPPGRVAADKAEVRAAKDLGQAVAAMAGPAVDDRAAKASPGAAPAEVSADRAAAAGALAAEGHRVPGVHRLDRGQNGLDLARYMFWHPPRGNAPN